MSDALRIAHGPFGRVAILNMDRSLVRHAHPHCHVLLKLDGDDTQFLVGDTFASLTDESAVLLNAWQTHAYVHNPVRQSAVILALYIEPGWLEGFRTNWSASAGAGFFGASTGGITPRISKLARQLAEEMMQATNAPEQERLLSDLMIAVIERFTEWQTVRAPQCSNVVDFRIRRAIATMRHDPGQIHGMSRLARNSGLSRAHFFRLFEQSTGLNPGVYLNALRVEQAVLAVRTGDDKLQAIGERLGFAAPPHFTRFFRDHVGVAPREFRAVSHIEHC